MRITTLAFVLLSATAALFGQTRLQANIPFQFSVSDKVVPAGEYQFIPVSKMVSKYILAEVSSGTWIYFTGLPGITAKGSKLPPHFLFRKYGDKYFLAGMASWDGGITVVKSESEREFVTVKWMARSEPETVIIAARSR